MLSLVLIWLHVVAAAVWVGGMVFFVTVLVPVVRSGEFATHSAAIVRATGRRFRTVGWTALAVLIVTGFGNLLVRGIGPAELIDTATWATPFGRLLGGKLVLVGLVLVLSTAHDLYVGPRAGAAAIAAPTSPAATVLRRRASLMGRANLVLALAIVALGVTMARGCGV